MASLRWSPRILNDTVVMAIARPGAITIQGAERMYPLPLLIIDPHVGIGG